VLRTRDKTFIMEKQTAIESDNSAPKPERQQSDKKRRRGNAYKGAYQGFTFQPIPSTGRPGTPHRFFAESYVVKEESGNATGMTVHQHANGLCIVTVGDNNRHRFSNDDDSTIQFHADDTPEMSTGAKRKLASAMLKGKKSQDTGVVHPSDLLLTVSGLSFPCCVFGMVLETNRSLTVDLLKRDPLLKGYLAVIMPTGQFPPTADGEAVAREPDTDKAS
jgi:hypothetical protein